MGNSEYASGKCIYIFSKESFKENVAKIGKTENIKQLWIPFQVLFQRNCRKIREMRLAYIKNYVLFI